MGPEVRYRDPAVLAWRRGTGENACGCRAVTAHNSAAGPKHSHRCPGTQGTQPGPPRNASPGLGDGGWNQQCGFLTDTTLISTRQLAQETHVISIKGPAEERVTKQGC